MDWSLIRFDSKQIKLKITVHDLTPTSKEIYKLHQSKRNFYLNIPGFIFFLIFSYYSTASDIKCINKISDIKCIREPLCCRCTINTMHYYLPPKSRFTCGGGTQVYTSSNPGFYICPHREWRLLTTGGASRLGCLTRPLAPNVITNILQTRPPFSFTSTECWNNSLARFRTSRHHFWTVHVNTRWLQKGVNQSHLESRTSAWKGLAPGFPTSDSRKMVSHGLKEWDLKMAPVSRALVKRWSGKWMNLSVFTPWEFVTVKK